MAARLKEKYDTEVRGKLQERFSYKNPMQIPKLEKVVINMSVTKAKKSIAAFKLREGMNIGAKVTLRGDRMYTFLDKLFNIVLPRIRDFRGLNRKSFDGRGNYNLGLREQLVFPEIDFDKVD